MDDQLREAYAIELTSLADAPEQHVKLRHAVRPALSCCLLHSNHLLEIAGVCSPIFAE